MPRITLIHLKHRGETPWELTRLLESITGDKCRSIVRGWNSTFIWFSNNKPRERHEQVYNELKTRLGNVSVVSVVKPKPLAAQLYAWLIVKSGVEFQYESGPEDEYALVYTATGKYVEKIAGEFLSPFESLNLLEILNFNVKSTIVQLGGIYFEVEDGVVGVLPRDNVDYFLETTRIPFQAKSLNADFCEALKGLAITA
jgi:uncharacterized protein (DUF2249 family)